MEELLMECGLSKNEAKVYVGLSKHGISTAYRISKIIGLYKANTYGALSRLVEKSVVVTKSIDNKSYYEAADPNSLLNLIDSKRQRLMGIMDSLRIMQHTVSSESSLNMYNGIDAHFNVLHHLLEYNEPILIYGVPKYAIKFGSFRIEKFHKERIKNKIQMKHIYNSDADSRYKEVKKLAYTAVRILPELFDSEIATVICGDEVVFLSWLPSTKTIRIKDKDLAKSYKSYFGILWSKARKV